MDLKLKGKTAIVTGGSAGIGLAIAQALAAEGVTASEGIVDFLKNISSVPNPTPEQAEHEFFEKHRSSSLLQRLIEAPEIANLVAFLASPLSSATNGAALRAEGGLLRSIV
jgi:NAD(P)-dependent dehydrogenase (short-subunit alcohol dehydrogenase family)